MKSDLPEYREATRRADAQFRQIAGALLVALGACLAVIVSILSRRPT